MTQERAHNAGPQKQNTNDKLTKYKLTQQPLIPVGIYKRVLHNLQYHDGCHVDQGSFIPVQVIPTSKNRAVNMTSHHPLLLPDPDLSFSC